MFPSTVRSWIVFFYNAWIFELKICCYEPDFKLGFIFFCNGDYIEMRDSVFFSGESFY